MFSTRFFTVIETASTLLGIEGERLEGVMKEKTIQLRGEYITSPQSVEQVVCILK